MISSEIDPSAVNTSVPPYSDYLQVAEWSTEDQCYVGSVPPLVGPACHGSKTDVASVFNQLDIIAEENLRILLEDQQKISLPEEADKIGRQLIHSSGQKILRCRLVDSDGRFVKDGAYQNLHSPCFLPLSSLRPCVSLESPEPAPEVRAGYLKFSSSLTVPILGLTLNGSGSYQVQSDNIVSAGFVTRQ